MTARAAQPGAASHEHLHGDEHLGRDLSTAEQRAIAARADQIIAERLDDGAQFFDLMAGIDPSAYEPYLHGAILHISNALSGDPIATTHVLEYVRKFALVINAEAKIAWGDECLEIAASELSKDETI